MIESSSQPPFVTPWAGLVPLDDLSGYLVHGCKPGKQHALSIAPRYITARGASPLKAYRQLTEITGHAWCVAVREHDLLNLDRAHWKEMVRAVPRIKIISEQLWSWAEPIWEGAWDELECASALWMALTAAQDEELRLAEEVPF